MTCFFEALDVSRVREYRRKMFLYVKLAKCCDASGSSSALSDGSSSSLESASSSSVPRRLLARPNDWSKPMIDERRAELADA